MKPWFLIVTIRAPFVGIPAYKGFIMKPDDVRMARFPKVHFGGYDMESVDAFLAKVETDLKEKEKERSIVK